YLLYFNGGARVF
nr:immunoglobulin light chain junction region [Macaca mulatta]MPN85470.1 immunoglobulin light chain junction region [Macaca mulatta]